MRDHERAHVEVHLTLEQFNASGPPDDVRWLFLNWLEGCRTLPGTAHSLRRIEARLERVLSALRVVAQKGMEMAGELEVLTVKVEKVVGAVESGKVAIVGLADALRVLTEKFTDFESLKAGVLAHAETLGLKADELAEAIAANPVPPPA